jgi:hypothetical protein
MATKRKKTAKKKPVRKTAKKPAARKKPVKKKAAAKKGAKKRTAKPARKSARRAPLKMSQATRDCLDDCAQAYDACMTLAGDSTAAQAVCNSRYSTCVNSCPT